MSSTKIAPAANYVLVDADGTIIARRATLGAVRNYARMSNAGKRGVAIVAPDGTRHPVRKPAA